MRAGKQTVMALALAGSALSASAQTEANQGAGPPQPEQSAFDAPGAWDEYEQLLRNRYAYLDRVGVDVEAQFARSREAARSAESPAAVRNIIRQTGFALRDPHLVINPYADGDYGYSAAGADLYLRFIEGRARIVDVRRGSPAFDSGLRPGSEILAIDGEPVGRAARLAFRDVLPEPDSAQLDYGLTLAANGRAGKPRVLTLVDDAGEQRTVTLQATGDFAKTLGGRPLVEWERVGERSDIALIRVVDSLFDNGTITAFDRVMDQVGDARAVILDLRDTPRGGNTEVARSIIGHFVSEPRPYQMHRIPSLEREFTVPRQFVEYVYPREPRFTGPVFVLHGHWTGSMGEGVVIGMDGAADAITIGSDMTNLLGAVMNAQLGEAKAEVYFAHESLFHVDGTPREDYVADIPIEPASTAQDGSDPALTKAIAFYEAKARVD